VKFGFRQSMAWLHTWSGLVVGWVLYVIFLTGSAAYFQEEITRWMQPEATSAPSPEAAAQSAVRFLQKVAPDADSWFITLPGRRSATTQVFWSPREAAPPSPRETAAVLDGEGREITARATQGGFFLYRFHFDLHYMPVMLARYIVGASAMFMLTALLSGIITHRKIFTEFFTLRLRKGQRSWLDAHNVMGVLALPFFLMITYTGLVTLQTQYMPLPILAVFEKPDSFFAASAPVEPVERSGHAAALTPLAPLFAKASAAWNGGGVGFLSVRHPGDANARVQLTRSSADAIPSRGETLSFDMRGVQLPAVAKEGGAARVESVMIGLHAGRYAQSLLRWLYFACGLMGAGMVGAGLVLWTVKRRQRLSDPARPHIGFQLVERLNIATIAGFPVGLASYFLSNRLLPLQMAERGSWEINCLFIAWGAVFVWAIGRPARAAWVEALGAAAVLFALVPVVNAVTTPRNLVVSLLAGDTVFAAFDLAMLCAAALIGWTTWKVHRHNQKARAV
jgi:uncharacterized iron-regulated membrane protein